MNPKVRRYAICTYSRGDEHLVAWKVYEILPDAQAAEDDYVRVVDESGEDYLYPAEFFVSLELPKEAEQALRGKSARPRSTAVR